MSRITKDYRSLVAEQVVRQGSSLDDGGAAPTLRSAAEEEATRTSRYRRVAALFSELFAQDDDAPQLTAIEPLRLQSPSQRG